MGKVKHDRHFHLNYSEDFLEFARLFKTEHPEEFELCETSGRPYGYSGLQVLYMMTVRQVIIKYSGIDFVPYSVEED